MSPGTTGAVVGCTVGLAGGLFGCYCSVHNAKGRPAKNFMLQCSTAMFVFIIVDVAGSLLFPLRLRWMTFVPWTIALPIAIHAVNRKLAALEREAAASAA